jgi:predicted transcriptional regulator
MHTVTLKADDNFFEILSDMTKELQTTKSDLIRKSVMHYKNSLEKELLKEQIKKASLKVRKHSLSISKELEDSLSDGLN